MNFTGYASLFGVPDAAGDIVLKGAFRQSLTSRGAAGIRMLFQHDPSEPLGAWLSLAEDDRGLRVTGRLRIAPAISFTQCIQPIVIPPTQLVTPTKVGVQL